MAFKHDLVEIKGQNERANSLSPDLNKIKCHAINTKYIYKIMTIEVDIEKRC